MQKLTENHGQNWLLGAYVVNGQINQRTQFNRGDKFSPYNFYFGKKGTDRKRTVFSEVSQQHAKTEYGVLVAQLFSISVNAVKR